MSVESQQHQRADAAPDAPEPAAPAAEPSMLKLDFSSNPSLRQVATMLRRVWLVDPPLPHEALADPAAARACFRDVCEAVGGDLTTDGAGGGGDDDDRDDRWDHAAWLARGARGAPGAPALVPPPVVTAAAASPDPLSVVSPWREEIYDVYRHVFADLWRGLEATGAAASSSSSGRFDPSRADAVSLVVLPAEAHKADRTAFRTDTFLFPVWVNPRAEVSLSTAGGGAGQHRWADGDEATWTTGLWVREGREVTLATRMEGAADDETGVAAVFVTGHCGERDGSAAPPPTGTSS